MDLLDLSWATWYYQHTGAAEVVQKDIFERPGLPLLEGWNMAFAALEELRVYGMNKQPSVFPPAFDLGMVETKTDKVYAPNALKIPILNHYFLGLEYFAPE